MRLTDSGEMPTLIAICSPVALPAHAPTSAPVAGKVWLGDEIGLVERSRPIQAFLAETLGHLATVFANMKLRGRSLRQGTYDQAAHHGLSTFRRQRAILMGVHSVLRDRLSFDNFSFLVQDRMHNPAES
ncbi:hypothetical protein A5906_23860 [Bradyrhizobium sacchari]|nr:hypothetical protein A5906_23860 [Bradyrhizobium sacchari]